jgi:hypothetical protein
MSNQTLSLNMHLATVSQSVLRMVALDAEVLYVIRSQVLWQDKKRVVVTTARLSSNGLDFKTIQCCVNGPQKPIFGPNRTVGNMLKYLGGTAST